MTNVAELVALGAVAGFTIFLGLPVALLGVGDRVKGFLNALAVGILLFLIVDVVSHAWETTTDSVSLASQGTGPVADAVLYLGLTLGGLALGLLSLVFYEGRYVGKTSGPVSASKLSTMIAVGIGAHNLSEGLAIGQSFASGAIRFAVVLVIGFAAHNSTEGFGIIAPLTGASPRPSVSFLAKVMFIGGAPTLIGTLLGSVSYSPAAYVFFLSLAGGALVYVTMMMFTTGRRQYSTPLVMGGVLIGLCAGLVTDLIVTLGGA